MAQTRSRSTDREENPVQRAQRERAEAQATLAGAPAAQREAEAEHAGQVAKERGDGGYVVLSSAISVKYGEKDNHVARLPRGRVFKPTEHMKKSGSVERLLQLRAIAENDGKPKTATTALLAGRAAGAADDPVPLPLESTRPMEVPRSAMAGASSATPGVDPTADEFAATAEDAGGDDSEQTGE